MKSALFFSGLILEILTFAQAYPQFGAEKKVTINGLTFDAMEPFISSDEQTLFFNSLNSGGNTNLYYATRVDDTTFNYVGLVGNTYDPSPSHLDAVPSLELNDRFFWVSLRDYPTIYENLLNADYSAGNVSGIKRTYGDFYVYLPGWLIMDACISEDGNFLYYVNAFFNSCDYGMPCESSIGVAQKVDDTTFNKLPDTDGLFSNINDAGYITYAPQLSSDGKELYFTRIMDGDINSELCVAVRNTPADTFSAPAVIYSNYGFVPEAITLTSDKSRIYYHQKNALGVFEIFMRYRTGTLGIDEKSEQNVVFYPNPAEEVICVSIKETKTPFSVDILTMNGKPLLHSENESVIPIGTLCSGVYILKFEQDSFSVTRLILIR